MSEELVGSGYALKRGPWKRKGGPCVECGSERCRSIRSFACWVRAFRSVLQDHNYIRICGASQPLRDAGIMILMAPQPNGNEIMFAPAWAVVLLKELREAATIKSRRLPRKQVEVLKTSRRNVPPPPELLARLDELRAFAALRGWRFEHGMWYR